MNALIVCNGKAPGKRLFKKYQRKSDLLIAADGGAKAILKHGFRPDFIIGDMDSFVSENPHNLIIIEDRDQETNDLEKALLLAKKRRISTVYILGATGQRTDHTLKNLSVLQQFNDLFKEISLVDSQGIIKVVPHNYVLKTKPGTPISLFPLSGKVDGIKTSGLKYELDDESLENGVRDGSSNEAIEKKVTIEYKTGCLLIIIGR